MACIVCEGEQTRWIDMPIDAKKDQETPYGRVVRCEGCGLGVVSPLPSPGEVPGFYTLSSYYTHGESHMPDPAPTLVDRLLTKAAWSVDRGRGFDPAAVRPLLPGRARVVDLGCGQAEQLQAFRDLGCEVVGVDPDEAARTAAGEAGITVLPGAAEELPETLAPGSFDLVLMTHSLEHCLDPVRAVANARSLLKPGGLFYCEVPNSACVHFAMFGACSEMFDAPRHLYFFSPANLRTLIEQRGFAVEAEVFNGYTRQHAPGWRAWETTIHDRVKHRDRGARVRRHGVAASIELLARSAAAPPERKYDCVGLLARAMP